MRGVVTDAADMATDIDNATNLPTGPRLRDMSGSISLFH
jgi:hypothetical protein